MSHKKLFYLTHFSCHFDTRLTGTERLALWHVTPNKKFYVFQPYFLVGLFHTSGHILLWLI